MEQASKIQRISTKRRMIGECLIEAGCINREVLDNALRTQKIQKKKLGQILIEMGAASDDEIAHAHKKKKAENKKLGDWVPSPYPTRPQANNPFNEKQE